MAVRVNMDALEEIIGIADELRFHRDELMNDAEKLDSIFTEYDYQPHSMEFHDAVQKLRMELQEVDHTVESLRIISLVFEDELRAFLEWEKGLDK